MKSKSANIRQMLRDIQAKRKKLDYQESKLLAQLAKYEGRKSSPAQAEVSRVVNEPVSNESQAVSVSGRTNTFGSGTHSGGGAFDATSIVQEQVALGTFRTTKELATYIVELAEQPKYSDGVVQVSLSSFLKPDGAKEVGRKIKEIDRSSRVVVL